MRDRTERNSECSVYGPSTHDVRHYCTEIPLVRHQHKTQTHLQDGDIRVMCENPLYGDVPYTVQTQGCGERGEHIHVTPDYLINVNQSANTIGPPGWKLIAKSFCSC